VILKEKIEIIKDFLRGFYNGCNSSEICALIAKKPIKI
jgi:hypothetical protein